MKLVFTLSIIGHLSATFSIINPVLGKSWDLRNSDAIKVDWISDEVGNNQVEVVLVKGLQSNLIPVKKLGSITMNKLSLQIDKDSLKDLAPGEDYSIKLINTVNGDYRFSHYFTVLNSPAINVPLKPVYSKPEDSGANNPGKNLSDPPVVIGTKNDQSNSKNKTSTSQHPANTARVFFASPLLLLISLLASI